MTLIFHRMEAELPDDEWAEIVDRGDLIVLCQ